MPTTGEPPGASVAAQFEDQEQQRSAVEQGVWVFLASEVMLLGAAMTAFTVYRVLFGRAFAAASARLEEALGAINTAVLLTSSLTMALAARAARQRQRGPLLWLLPATAGLGALFLGVKAVEYSRELGAGLLPGPGFAVHGEGAARQELFFGFYWALTGLHALHLGIGVVLIGGLWLRLLPRGREPRQNATLATGLYWHFVDIVWIFLFPLLYLVEAILR